MTQPPPHPTASTSPAAHCTRCGFGVLPGDRFCGACGASLVICAVCGRPLPPDATACPACGAAVHGTGDGPDSARAEQSAGDSAWERVVARLREALADEFEILTDIGHGGMAAVFLARDLTLERHVALKVLAPGLLTGEGMVERFRQEAVTVANLQHPHIVTVHGVRVADELPLYVMQYVRGRSVDRALRDKGPFSAAAVRGILYHVGSALDYAHRRGVIHRDIKPANILVNADGDALVTDFGIAKVAEAPGYTRAGMVVGTPAYMSPEQCIGAEVTGASDQYSLGVVAYEMLAGRAPFHGSNLAIMRAHADQLPPPLSGTRPDLPPGLEAAVLRMLAKRRDDRFPDLPTALMALEAHPFGATDPIRSELREIAGAAAEEIRLAALLQKPTRGLGVGVRRSRPASPPPGVSPSRQEGIASGRSDARRAAVEVTELRIDAPDSTIDVGESVVLAVTALDAVGGLVDGPRVRWESSDPTIATVDAVGVLAGVGPGTVVVTASADRVSAACEVTVVAAGVASIDVDVPAEVRAGTRTTLSATARDRRGRAMSTPVRWSSRSPAVATVSAQGVLSAKRRGTAILVAEADGTARAVSIPVGAPPVAEVVIADGPATLVVGATAALRAVLRTASGLPDDEARAVEWRSSDPGIALVSSTGVVTARAPGAVTITATCDGAAGSLAVTVVSVAAATVVISAAPPSLRLGETVTLRAAVRDATGRSIKRPIAWRSTDPAVASVDERGRVTACAEGWAIITAEADGAQAHAEVLVRPHLIPRSASGHRETRRSAALWILFLAVIAAIVVAGWRLTR